MPTSVTTASSTRGGPMHARGSLRGSPAFPRPATAPDTPGSSPGQACLRRAWPAASLAALEVAGELPVRDDLVVEDDLLLLGGVQQVLEHEVAKSFSRDRGASER